jgi:hypothetical protein
MVQAKESSLMLTVHEASISTSSLLAPDVFDAGSTRHGALPSAFSGLWELLVSSKFSTIAAAPSKVRNDIAHPVTTSKSTARVKVRVLAADGRGELWPISAIVMAGS